MTHSEARVSPRDHGAVSLELPMGGSLATYHYNVSLLRAYDDTNVFSPPETPPTHEYRIWLIKRVKIALCTLPLVGIVLFLRWVLWLDIKNPYVAPIDSIIVAPVITCVVFVMSTVYANVIADWKEAEKLPVRKIRRKKYSSTKVFPVFPYLFLLPSFSTFPIFIHTSQFFPLKAELVSYFEALMSISVSEARASKFDHRPMCRQIELMLLPVLSTLDNSTPSSDFKLLSWDFGCAAAKFLALARIGSGKSHEGGHGMQLEVVEHAILEIKKKWTRIHDISRLSIILPAYTIMDALCILLCGTLVCANYNYFYSPPSSIYMAITVFSFVAFYLNLMVRGLDDPFDGPPHFHYRSYCYSCLPPMTLWEAWCYPTQIDFECLTVSMGSNLRRLCTTEPAALNTLMREHGSRFGHSEGDMQSP